MDKRKDFHGFSLLFFLFCHQTLNRWSEESLSSPRESGDMSLLCGCDKWSSQLQRSGRLKVDRRTESVETARRRERERGIVCKNQLLSPWREERRRRREDIKNNTDWHSLTELACLVNVFSQAYYFSFSLEWLLFMLSSTSEHETIHNSPSHPSLSLLSTFVIPPLDLCHRSLFPQSGLFLSLFHSFSFLSCHRNLCCYNFSTS